MTIFIAETGKPPGDLGRHYGSYGNMMVRMLDTAAARRGVGSSEMRPVNVEAGDVLPHPTEGDALLITGSPAGVYEPHAWIEPAMVATRAFAETDCPVVGICFGHQLMAKAFGGHVEKSDKGWGVGLHRYAWTADAPAFAAGAGESFACVVSHQDQVVALPPGAVRLAGSDFCENGAIAYASSRVVSFQMHPEFEHGFARALLDLRADRIGGAVVNTARESFGLATDRDHMADWIYRILMGDVQ